mmetsp:Transcript_8353/g.18938  ORF Transcript_8353/g.18938 Transcript_8353/m.18938 type:complete len:290 (+) Transcript_8353:129-998(+)
MKINYEICIVGQKCVLVPYRRLHVERYHEWMKSSELLEATGSEPLSLAEEYEMQQSWKLDESKCTFIVLDKDKCHFQSTNKENETSYADDDGFVERNHDSMVGDVNLFLSEIDDEEDEDPNDAPSQDKPDSNRIQGEVDIMIAEDGARGKGIGKVRRLFAADDIDFAWHPTWPLKQTSFSTQEATALMIQYGTTRLKIERFFVKINQDNTASRGMFQRSLKFVECNYAECFQQYEYELFRKPQREDAEGQTQSNAMDAIDSIVGTCQFTAFHCAAPHDETESLPKKVGA